MCDWCKEDDTIEHFFLYCDNVVRFWLSLQKWWNRVAKTSVQEIKLNEKNILFGINSSNKFSEILNHIILLAKKYIHDCKLTKNAPLSFFSFLAILKQEIIYEEEIAIGNNTYNWFRENWFWILEQI